MDINRKLKTIIINIALNDIDESSITAESILTNDFGFDSVQIINLIVELESQFDIEIEDDDLDIEKLTIYKNLFEMIDRKLKRD